MTTTEETRRHRSMSKDPTRSNPLDSERAREAMRWMLLWRTLDSRLISLQRQGRLGTYSAGTGQEATVVGAAMAVDPQRDWIAQAYREMPAVVRHGWPLESFVSYWRGDIVGGRIPDDCRVLPVQIALAAQLPQAVGLAWGLTIRDEPGVVLAFFGDGASSEGDAHEALNLAGVRRAPIVFILQNNGWAISTPTRLQSATDNFAARAAGYGLVGCRVDGNDVEAVHAETAVAVERARSGEGPTLIESVTYRLAAHNTADDPTRYANAEELEEWATRDPIARYRAVLQERGIWTEEWEGSLLASVDAEITNAIDASLARAPLGQADLFNEAYARPPQRLMNQRSSRIPVEVKP